MDWIKKASRKAKDLVHEYHESSGQAYPGQNRQQGQQGQHGQQPYAPRQTPLSAPVRVDDKFPSVRGRDLGQQASNFPHVFRDGGGGGTVGGQHIIMFADGMYTRGPPPTDPSQMVSFVSNSVAVFGASNAATTHVARVTDVGTADRGPDEAIPWVGSETAAKTAVWPNCNIATVVEADGNTRDVYGVAFPEVIDRDAFRAQGEALLYNTAVAVRLDAQHRPRVTRPVQSLFRRGETTYGSFCVYSDAVDSAYASAGGSGGGTAGSGHLYLFGRVSEATQPRSNGLKLARVRAHGEAWADRRQYEFWDGRQWTRTMPRMIDDGQANVLHYTVDGFGKQYGPGSGDVWWSAAHQAFVLLFQNAAAALDSSVYLSYSPTLTGGWSVPKSVYQLPRAPDGFSYAFHAYPNMVDATGTVVPITWTKDSKSQSCRIFAGEIVIC